MMLERLYSEAGFGHFAWTRMTLVLAMTALGVGLSLIRITGIVGFGVAGFILSLAAFIEAFKMLAQRREQALVDSLPELIEALAAAVASGQELGQALAEQSQNGPKSLAKSLSQMNRLAEQGWSLERLLDWLQVELSNVYADQLIQLLLVSLRIGGHGLVANLDHLSQTIRSQAALDSELSAKQGWVTGTAKLGLAAPWLIVAFLNARPEAHAFYSSGPGLALLIVGLFICLLAYLFILAAGKLPRSRRVFVNVA